MDSKYKPSPYIDRPDRTHHVQDKVISGNAELKRESFGDKLIHMFISEDIDDVKRYLIEDVIVPGIKDAILDGISMIFNHSPYYRSSSRSGYTSYSNSSNKNTKSTTTKIGGRSTGFRPPIVETRADAEEAFFTVKDLIENSDAHCASVLDLYSACGLDCDFAKDAYGWTSIEGMRMVRERDGRWSIECPKPELLTNLY